VTTKSPKGGNQTRRTCARIWIAAPRQRMGPRSRYWVIVLFVRAATSQPKNVVPYL
jgi:hypothetical protein